MTQQFHSWACVQDTEKACPHNDLRMQQPPSPETTQILTATEAINCSGAILKMEHDSSVKRSKLLTGRKLRKPINVIPSQRS